MNLLRQKRTPPDKIIELFGGNMDGLEVAVKPTVPLAVGDIITVTDDRNKKTYYRITAKNNSFRGDLVPESEVKHETSR